MSPGEPRIGVAPEAHARAFVTLEHELRITQRCLVDDLGLSADSTFEDVQHHPIVKAFVAKRQTVPADGETIGPAAGVRTLYKLRGATRSRGATLFDADERVVWLCAYGYHESGSPDDAYRRFESLMREHRLEPVMDDFVALGRERKRRFTDLVVGHAEAAIREALQQADPNGIQAVLGRSLPVRLAVRHDGDLLEVRVSVPVACLNEREQDVHVALAALARDDHPSWELMSPGGFVLSKEIGFMLYSPLVATDPS